MFFPVTLSEYVPGFVPFGNTALTLPLLEMLTFTFFIALPLASTTLEVAMAEVKVFGNEVVKVVGLLNGLPVEVLGDGFGEFVDAGVGDFDVEGDGEGLGVTEGVGVGAGPPPPPPPPPPPLDGVTTPVIETAVGAIDLDPEPIMFTD